VSLITFFQKQLYEYDLQDALLLDHSLVAPALLLLSQFPLDVRSCWTGLADVPRQRRFRCGVALARVPSIIGS